MQHSSQATLWMDNTTVEDTGVHMFLMPAAAMERVSNVVWLELHSKEVATTNHFCI